MNKASHPDSAPYTFGPLPTNRHIGRALESMGYREPTPVQERSIPVLRQGRDLLAQAQTGTGKTAAFGIPIIETVRPQERHVQAIVLVPTRELCIQVTDELKSLASGSGIQVIAVYGGVGLGPQITALQRGAHVMIGTPGRVEDLLQRGALNLGRVRFAVLDEADRMLDIGFLPAIERIFERLPAERQTALFSATIPQDVRGLAHRQLRNPVTVEVDPERATVDEIEQRFQRVEEQDKLTALRAYLDDPACYLALVFRRTTYKVDRLVRDLSRKGYKVGALHGRRSQSQRERVLGDLKSGKLQAVIATDVAARGLDIANLTHVFNYDLPDTPETYVHRIGRTGRAGELGTAVTFVTPDDEQDLRQIERYLDGRRDGRSAGSEQQRSSRPGAPRIRGGAQGQPRHDARRPGDRQDGPLARPKDGPQRTGRPSRRRRGKRQSGSSAA